MKNLRYILGSLVLLIGAGLLLPSCQKNPSIAIHDVVFTDSTSGYQVMFFNKTTGAQSYKWDFGDGGTSTQTSPTHTYTSKGKFVATLTATLTNGNQISGSTIIHVSKSSPIKLNDNSLADWDTISNEVIPTGSLGGIVKLAKFDYDSNNIYIYMQLNTTVAADNVFDFYLDTDDDATTGLVTGDFPGGGFDYLLEGNLLSTPQPNGLIQYQHVGAQSAFSFNALSIADFYTLGTVQEVNGVVTFEMGLSRSKIGGLTGPALRFGIIVSDSGYNPLGFMPGDGVTPITLNISQ
jgi:hypothetical protein